MGGLSLVLTPLGYHGVQTRQTRDLLKPMSLCVVRQQHFDRGDAAETRRSCNDS
jgi:hypothetical protein